MTVSPDYANGFSAGLLNASAKALAAINSIPVPTPTPAPSPTPMQFGTNLESNTEYQTSAPWCDLTHQMTGWYSVNGATINYDANGYPSSVSGPAGAAAQSHTWLYNYPTSGKYTVRWVAPPATHVSVAAKSFDNGITKNPDGSFQGTITLGPWDVGNPDGQNAGSGFQFTVRVDGPISNLQVLVPDAVTSQSFRPDFINRLKSSGYKMLRLMNWCRVNYDPSPSTPRPPLLWANRVKPTDYDQVSRGVAYEYMAELSALTGLPIWVNSSYGCEPAYDAGMAGVFNALPPMPDLSPRIWYEKHNEPWNTGAGYQGNQIAADGNADPAIKAKAGGNGNIAAALQYAKSVTQMASVIRPILGPKVKIVFGGQAAFGEFARWGLPALAPGAVDTLAVAPYFQPTWSSQYPTGQTLLNGNVTPLTLLLDCQTWIEKVLQPGMAANLKAAQAYGCGFDTYEAGESLMPKTDVSVFHQASFQQQQALLADPNTQANFHPLMAVCYIMTFQLCRSLGVKWFTHFLLWGGWSKSGEWGVWQNPGDPGNAKSWALTAALNGWV